MDSFGLRESTLRVEPTQIDRLLPMTSYSERCVFIVGDYKTTNVLKKNDKHGEKRARL